MAFYTILLKDNNHEKIPFLLNPIFITRLLISIAFLIAASLIGEWLVMMPGQMVIKNYFYLVDLDEEYNMPTYFSVMLMLFADAILMTIAARTLHGDISKWIVLGSGFFAMACDELFMLHKRLIFPVRSLWGNVQLGIFYYAWVVPGIALVGFRAVFFFKFLWRLPATTRIFFTTAAFLYLGGCISFKLIGGWYAEKHGAAHFLYN